SGESGDESTGDVEPSVGHWVGAEQGLTAGVGHLKVVIAVRQPGRRSWSMRSRPPVQIDSALGWILIGIDYRAVCSSREDRSRNAAGGMGLDGNKKNAC